MKEYLIKKGNHYASGLHFGVHFGITEQKYKVRFSKECLYLPDWENDWNKLCGWSYGLHHKNSIRVCWRPLVVDNKITGEIELCIYVYEDGTRKTSNSIRVNTEQDILLELILYPAFNEVPARIFLSVDTLPYGLLMFYSTKPSWGYRLYPYIGGDNVAEVDTKIYLEKL